MVGAGLSLLCLINEEERAKKVCTDGVVADWARGEFVRFA
ncbi:MAG: hypothetical protein BWY29_00004 [Microgenomates group bacterium ADurb.Bin238]|jgi:hypothetical protein|nr:MAG: hypothetical protein BWY29_00004 [Microgenomates group bacterium ADurb.Bin238]